MFGFCRSDWCASLWSERMPSRMIICRSCDQLSWIEQPIRIRVGQVRVLDRIPKSQLIQIEQRIHTPRVIGSSPVLFSKPSQRLIQAPSFHEVGASQTKPKVNLGNLLGISRRKPKNGKREISKWFDSIIFSSVKLAFGNIQSHSGSILQQFGTSTIVCSSNLSIFLQLRTLMFPREYYCWYRTIYLIVKDDLVILGQLLTLNS